MLNQPELRTEVNKVSASSHRTQELNERSLFKGQSPLRLVFFTLASVLLNLTVFMSAFIPFPLSFLYISYGRLLGLVAALTGLGLTVWLEKTFFSSGTMILTYGFGMFLGLCMGEIVKRKKRPTKALVYLGLFLFFAVSASLMLLVHTKETSMMNLIQQQLVTMTAELKQKNPDFFKVASGENRDLVDMLSQPDLLAQDIVKNLPAGVFMGVFALVWINLFLLLRSVRFFLGRMVYPFSERSLLRFKVYEWMVWPLIVSLALVLLGEEVLLMGFEASWMAMTILKCLAVFYFFQGLGVYFDFLDSLRLFSFLRTFFILFTVVSIPWVIAGIGLFDMWINFRRFLKPKL